VAYRVLIVGESPAMRVFLRREIEASGFDLSHCFEADNGEEALEVLRGEWVDAILTDVNMPHMDGEELLRRLEADELLRSIPAIVVSTDASRLRIERLLALGARGYIVRPFQPEHLRAELERTLEAPAPLTVVPCAG
jgi:two-component system, chemotaxis family, chemotaxis protein CheY